LLRRRQIQLFNNDPEEKIVSPLFAQEAFCIIKKMRDGRSDQTMETRLKYECGPHYQSHDAELFSTRGEKSDGLTRQNAKHVADFSTAPFALQFCITGHAR